MREGNPNQALGTAKSPDAKSGGKDIMDEEGLKLRLELNIDIEIELKASIHGDPTLALFKVLIHISLGPEKGPREIVMTSCILIIMAGLDF